PGPSVFPDFSDPAVRHWWASLVPSALDRGVRGLWIDMNEPSDFAGPAGTVPDELAANGDGEATTMAEMHNVYALNEARAIYDRLIGEVVRMLCAGARKSSVCACGAMRLGALPATSGAPQGTRYRALRKGWVILTCCWSRMKSTILAAI
ncbi:MAG: hypothetical protein KKC72_03275, partial [Alphaproteobacteria bacterium]|nr:hypothetical protein [Alphaproteobacteria bacterium]